MLPQYTASSETFLDLFIFNFDAGIATSGVIVRGVSDYSPI